MFSKFSTSIISASLLLLNLSASEDLTLNSLKSYYGESSTGSILEQKISPYSTLEISISNSTDKSDPDSGTLAKFELFKQNSKIFFDGDIQNRVNLSDSRVSVTAIDGVDSSGFIEDGDLTFRVEFIDKSLLDDRANYQLILNDPLSVRDFTTDSKEIDSNSPYIKDSIKAGDRLYIFFSEALRDSNLNGVDLTQIDEGDFSGLDGVVELSNPSFLDSDSSILIFTIDSGEPTRRVVDKSSNSDIVDIFGNPIKNSEETITVKETPVVLSAKAINSNSIEVEFSKEMSEHNKSAYQILDSELNPISIEIDSIYSDDNLTFRVDLSDGEIESNGTLLLNQIEYPQFSIMVDETLKDLDNYSLEEANITISLVKDFIPATITSASLRDRDLDGVVETLELKFDENMNTAIENISNLELTPEVNSLDLNSLNWRDSQTLDIALEINSTDVSGYSLSLDSELYDESQNAKVTEVSNLSIEDGASPTLIEAKFYDNLTVKEFDLESLSFTLSGVKSQNSEDILELKFSENLKSLNHSLIEFKIDNSEYQSIESEDINYEDNLAILKVGDAIDAIESKDSDKISNLTLKFTKESLSDSSENNLSEDLIFENILDYSPLYINSDSNLSAIGSKVIVEFSESIESIESALESFSIECQDGDICTADDFEEIDSKIIAIDFGENIKNGTYLNYSKPESNGVSNLDSKELNSILDEVSVDTIVIDSLDTDYDIADSMDIYGEVLNSNGEPIVAGTKLIAFLTTNGYIENGKFITSKDESFEPDGKELKKAIEPFIVGATVITKSDGRYSMKIQNDHGGEADIIILAQVGGSGEYIPLTSANRFEPLQSVGTREVQKHIKYNKIYSDINGNERNITLGVSNFVELNLDKTDGDRFNSFYLPVKRYYYSSENYRDDLPSEEYMLSDLKAIQIDDKFGLNQLLLAIESRDGKYIPYLTQAHIDSNYNLIDEGLRNCVKMDGKYRASIDGISSLDGISAGYGVGCTIDGDSKSIYLFGESLAQSDKFEKIAGVNSWSFVGNWRYSGFVDGDNQFSTPTADEAKFDNSIEYILRYDSHFKPSSYNMDNPNGVRDSIELENLQNGDDALFIKFNGEMSW